MHVLSQQRLQIELGQHHWYIGGGEEYNIMHATPICHNMYSQTYRAAVETVHTI